MIQHTFTERGSASVEEHEWYSSPSRALILLNRPVRPNLNNIAAWRRALLVFFIIMVSVRSLQKLLPRVVTAKPGNIPGRLTMVHTTT